MLEIQLSLSEAFDDEKQEFIVVESVKIELEHSLVSLSKWESKFQKPFLSSAEKTNEELIGYVAYMILTPGLTTRMFEVLTQNHINEINTYINSKMTATWMHEDPNAPKSSEIVTAELIYYWMLSLNIPFECQHWHLNRLMTLIKVCHKKNTPPKKMSKQALAKRNRELNEQRHAQFGTKG